jgi:voltage-gated potassium channel
MQPPAHSSNDPPNHPPTHPPARPQRASARRPRWGLRLASTDDHGARRAERHWRLPVLLALATTIPAFYSELLQAAPSQLATLAYGVAAGVTLLALWHTARRTRRPREHWLANPLDLLLVAGLLAAALAPASHGSNPALALRLAVAFVTLARMVWALQHLLTRGGLGYLLLLAAAILALCGAGYWWLEPTTPTFMDGLWLAFATAATVGYGDVVPTTPAAKIFSVFVVMLGFGVLMLLTAAIAARWVEDEERAVEREILAELRHQMRELRAEIAALRQERQTPAHDPARAEAQGADVP